MNICFAPRRRRFNLGLSTDRAVPVSTDTVRKPPPVRKAVFPSYLISLPRGWGMIPRGPGVPSLAWFRPLLLSGLQLLGFQIRATLFPVGRPSAVLTWPCRHAGGGASVYGPLRAHPVPLTLINGFKSLLSPGYKQGIKPQRADSTPMGSLEFPWKQLSVTGRFSWIPGACLNLTPAHGLGRGMTS